MSHHAEFRDPLLVSVYDAENLWARDDDFFLSVVNEEPACRVVDLGCGSGRLALAMAAAGHQVTGVDPAQASLAAARGKAGADGVAWIEGTSRDLPDACFDIAVMTSHVAQFFVEDDEWAVAIADLRRSVIPGGRLVFDSRDPRARRWERWNPVDSRRRIALPGGVIVVAWTEVTAAQEGAVSFTQHYEFSDGGDLVSTATLRFRKADEIRASLLAGGFDVQDIYGGWKREPIGADDGELLVIARARRQTTSPPS